MSENNLAAEHNQSKKWWKFKHGISQYAATPTYAHDSVARKLKNNKTKKVSWADNCFYVRTVYYTVQNKTNVM